MRRRLLAVLAAGLLAAAGCGDSGDGETPASPNDGAAASTELRATDFAFDPETIEVDPGEEVEVTLVNAGNVTHSFTAEDVDVDVEAETGQETSATFTAPDEDTTIQYMCRFHPSQMKGEIVVGDGGSEPGGGSDDDGSDDDGSDDSGGYDY